MKSIRMVLALAGLFVAVTVHANLIREKFVTDPASAGWQIYGDTNFFQWNSTNQALDVTWDSTQTNSFFFYPLGWTYTEADGFYLQFDLQLKDITGTGGQLAVGLFRYADATNQSYVRTYGTMPNVCELDYFTPDVYGDPESIAATLIDARTHYYFPYDNQLLNPGVTCRVELIHPAGTTVIHGQVYTNGQIMTTLPSVYANGATSFQLDTLSVSSYQSSGFGDILAHGSVGNLGFVSPLPVIPVSMVGGRIQFASDTNWQYTLEQSADLKNWSPAAAPVLGSGGILTLPTTNSPSGSVFYRVSADFP